jgi:hypothetical protein
MDLVPLWFYLQIVCAASAVETSNSEITLERAENALQHFFKWLVIATQPNPNEPNLNTNTVHVCLEP